MDRDQLQSAIEPRPGALFPEPDWGRVARLVGRDEPGWREATEVWAAALRRACGPFYQQLASERTVLLTPFDAAQAAALLERIDAWHKCLPVELPGLAEPPGRGPLVVVHFPGALPYREYVRPAYPDPAVHAAAEGVCVDRGKLHVVLYGESRAWVESVILHQLVHAHTRHLALPGWLDEGLAMALEERLLEPGAPRPLRLSSTGSLSPSELDLFWKGTPFLRGHASGPAAPELALAITRQLLSSPDRFISFATAAVRSPDSGRAAARERLSVNLDALANRLNEGGGLPWPFAGASDNPRLRHLQAPTRRAAAVRSSISTIALVLAIVLLIALVPTCGRGP